MQGQVVRKQKQMNSSTADKQGDLVGGGDREELLTEVSFHEAPS